MVTFMRLGAINVGWNQIETNFISGQGTTDCDANFINGDNEDHAMPLTNLNAFDFFETQVKNWPFDLVMAMSKICDYYHLSNEYFYFD